MCAGSHFTFSRVLSGARVVVDCNVCYDYQKGTWLGVRGNFDQYLSSEGEDIPVELMGVVQLFVLAVKARVFKVGCVACAWRACWAVRLRIARACCVAYYLCIFVARCVVVLCACVGFWPFGAVHRCRLAACLKI